MRIWSSVYPSCSSISRLALRLPVVADVPHGSDWTHRKAGGFLDAAHVDLKSLNHASQQLLRKTTEVYYCAGAIEPVPRDWAKRVLAAT
jgi:hypothetical protein